MFPSVRCLFAGFFLLVLGVAIGALFMRDIQPRSLLAVSDCKGSCYRVSEISGLIVASGLLHPPKWIPRTVRETEKCVAIANPFPEARHHFVLFPKRDIRNIGDVAVGDQAYLLDCIGLMQALIKEYHLKDYRAMTNGPGLQRIAYLHFHLMADE